MMMPCIFKNSRAFWQIYMSKAFAWIRCCTPLEHYDGVAAAWCWRRAIQKGSCKFLDFHTPAGGKWMLECWREQKNNKKQLWIHLASSFFSFPLWKAVGHCEKTLWCRNNFGCGNSKHQFGWIQAGWLVYIPSRSLTVCFPLKSDPNPIGK